MANSTLPEGTFPDRLSPCGVEPRTAFIGRAQLQGWGWGLMATNLGMGKKSIRYLHSQSTRFMYIYIYTQYT